MQYIRNNWPHERSIPVDVVDATSPHVYMTKKLGCFLALTAERTTYLCIACIITYPVFDSVQVALHTDTAQALDAAIARASPPEKQITVCKFP